MTRTTSLAGALGALALTAVAVPTGVSFAFAGADRRPPETAPRLPTSQEESFLGGVPQVPAALTPPPGNALHAVLKARGVQIFECRRGMWQPLEPVASLTGVTMNPVRKITAVHFRGPSWASDQDGSSVQGATPVTAPAADPANAPQQLYRATATRGGGVFGAVTYIQRIDTHGGAAPTTSCGGDAPTAIPYRAVYRFFTKK